MARTEERSAGVRFPFAKADDVYASGVQRIAVTGAAQSFVFPSLMKRGFVFFAFRANGSGLIYGQVAASLGAAPLSLNQISNAATAASSAAAGLTLLVDEVMDRMVLDGADRLNWIGNTSGGFVEFYISENAS
jgi:hypothetical protein